MSDTNSAQGATATQQRTDHALVHGRRIHQLSKHTASLSRLLNLHKKSFLSPEETAQALAFHAKQMDYVQRMEEHSGEKAHEKAQAILQAYASGESSDFPPTADDLRMRFYNISQAIHAAANEWAYTSGMREFCEPILTRAVQTIERTHARLLAQEAKEAEALEIPFEPSQTVLTVEKAAQLLQSRITNLSQFHQTGNDAPYISHVLKEFVDWKA